MATLRDVAEAAGVSVQTVSNVVNARPVVHPETRARVEAALRRLRYLPNSAARGLRRSRAQAIGFFVADPSPCYLADPFHGAVLTGIADVLRERGYALLIHAVRPGDADAGRLVDPLRQKLVDGAVVTLAGSGRERERFVGVLGEAGAPFVLLEQETRLENAAAVLGENRRGAFEATRHLLGRGHRTLVFLAPPLAWPAVEERIAGFREAVAKAGRSTSGQVVRCPQETVEQARAAVRRLLDAPVPPTAFFGANDRLAAGALEALAEAGRRCPQEAAVMGFDDFDFARLVHPRLSTVSLSGDAMGRAAAELLVGRIETGRFGARRVGIPTRLVVRESA